jgi:non-ribosomal peptide synthase protein (TIGR01720 family)
MEGHGREIPGAGLDVSRTVGWFTSMYPVLVDIDGASNWSEILTSVKAQLRAVPNHGIGYGIMRYLRESRSPATLPTPEIAFNYLGQFDQIFAGDSIFAREIHVTGPERSLRGERSHLLSITALVMEKRLRIDLGYSANQFQASTMERLSAAFLKSLRSLIADSGSETSGSANQAEPDDFGWSESQLEEITAAIGGTARSAKA